MQYEAIRDERRMAANTATRIGDAFLSLLSFGQSFLDVFLRKDVDDTAKGRITFNNGAVNKGIVVFSEDGTFADGLTGHGARICPDGSAELDSLTLRRFLEVPELRFNRVSVQVGNQWRAPGGGIIRSVSPAADATGTALLHLEAGEIGTVAVGDLCMGIYHSETASDNAEANSDDNHGNFRFAGFYTAYWEITAVEDYTDGETGQTFHNGKVSYRLRPVSANYPRQMHPTAAMHFVCYGNRTDTARQSSRYSTLTYERFLTGVSDWEFSPNQIQLQVGDLNAFSPNPGMDFSGYSVYANNIYLDGYLKQLAEMGDPNPYTYSVDNLADTLALDAKGQPKQPVVSTLADGSKSWLLHTSIQVRRGQTLLTCQEDATATPTTGQYRLLCLPVGCTAHFDHSTLYIDSVDYASRPTAYVEVTIDCEGRAALTYVFTIKVIADGDRGEQGRDGTAYGTRRRYALSARTTTASPHTPPDDVATWQDVPLTTTDARPYLWIELTDWQQQAGGLQTFSPLSSYVRLTGDRGQRGEDGLDGKDGKSWTLRGTAFGHVTNMASLPSPAPDGVFLVDTGAEGTPVAVRRMGGAWASITTNQGDAYILAGDVWMATETAWANLGRIQGEKGDRGQAGANGRTSRIYQRLDDGQQLYDGTTITADGFCYIDFYAVPSDAAKSGWDVYRCVQSYIYQAAEHALPPADTDHWRSVGVNADSAFFSFLIARDARIDFLQGNAIAIRKKHATAPYAGMGGDFPFWAGVAQPYPDGSGFNGSTYTFAVDEAGNLFASSAYLTGTIHATSGSIGGFAIQDRRTDQCRRCAQRRHHHADLHHGPVLTLRGGPRPVRHPVQHRGRHLGFQRKGDLLARRPPAHGPSQRQLPGHGARHRPGHHPWPSARARPHRWLGPAGRYQRRLQRAPAAPAGLSDLWRGPAGLCALGRRPRQYSGSHRRPAQEPAARRLLPLPALWVLQSHHRPWCACPHHRRHDLQKQDLHLRQAHGLSRLRRAWRLALRMGRQDAPVVHDLEEKEKNEYLARLLPHRLRLGRRQVPHRGGHGQRQPPDEGDGRGGPCLPQRDGGPILGHGPTGAPLPWLHGFRRDLAILSRHGPPAGGVVRPLSRTLRRG